MEKDKKEDNGSIAVARSQVRTHVQRRVKLNNTSIKKLKLKEKLYSIGDSEMVASQEFDKMLSFFRSRDWNIERIVERSLPKDFHHNNTAGYRITKKKEEFFEDEELEK